MQARMGEALKGVPASILIRGDAVAIQISVYEISFITGCVSSQMNTLGFVGFNQGLTLLHHLLHHLRLHRRRIA